MKPKSQNLTRSLTSPQGGTVLDWPVESGIGDQFLNQVEGRRKKNRRRRRVTRVASVFVVISAFAAFWGIPYLRDTAKIDTPAAHRVTLTLADGSRLDLNARTAVRTDFRHSGRLVHLDRGEAFFSVTKDMAHPFLVETPAGNVRVTGTKFNVRLADENHVEVTLLEGSILAENAGGAVVKLAPGQQVILDDSRPALRVLTVPAIEDIVAWRQGRLAFDGLTLSEAAARISAYHGCTITVAPGISDLRPGGSFPVDDLPAILRALEKALSVEAQANPDGSYRIVAR